MSDRRSQLALVVLLLAALLAIGHAAFAAAVEQGPEQEAAAEVAHNGGESAQTAACAQAVELLQQQKGLLTRELAQLKRELALLRESVAKPGLKEIFSGIGYILGLAGVGFFVHCRNQQKKS